MSARRLAGGWLAEVSIAGTHRDGLAGVRGDRVQRQVRVVALAQQHPQSALALATVTRRRGESPAKQGEGAVDLALARLRGDRLLDELGGHTTRVQGLSDPVAAPLVELAL